MQIKTESGIVAEFRHISETGIGIGERVRRTPPYGLPIQRNPELF